MAEQPLAAIILAAGQGTRMKSELHKVLHPVAGLPMLHHLLDSLAAAGAARQVVVVGARREQVEASVASRGVDIAHQAEQLGTAHAALQAKAALAGFYGIAIVCFGDTPFLRPETLARLKDRLLAEDAPRVAVLGFVPDDAKAYGRIIADDAGAISKMVEFKDATRTNARSGCAIPASPRCARPICGRCSNASATTMRRANIICPTSSCWRWPMATRRWWSRPIPTN